MVCSVKALKDVFNYLYSFDFTEVYEIDESMSDMYIKVKHKNGTHRCFSVKELISDIDKELKY